MDSCYNDGLATTAVFTRVGCPPNAVITVRGMNFPLNNTVVVTVGDRPSVGFASSVTVTCQTPKVASAGIITCVLPVVPSGTELSFYEQLTLVNVQFVQSAVQSNITAIVYSLPDLPVITSITSTCLVQNGPLTVSSCRAGDVLTISGQYLTPSFGGVVYGLGPINSRSFNNNPTCDYNGYSASNTNTSVRCSFGRFYAGQLFNVSVPYVLSVLIGPSLALWDSNAVFVSFINSTAPTLSNAATSLSPQRSAVGVLAVLTVVAALCMTA